MLRTRWNYVEIKLYQRCFSVVSTSDTNVASTLIHNFETTLIRRWNVGWVLLLINLERFGKIQWRIFLNGAFLDEKTLSIQEKIRQITWIFLISIMCRSGTFSKITYWKIIAKLWKFRYASLALIITNLSFVRFFSEKTQEQFKHLWWSLFVEIANSVKMLTLFAKTLHRRYFTKF